MGFSSIIYGSAVIALKNIHEDFNVIVKYWIGVYGLLGLIFMLYPIGGLIADLRYGRYKVIKLSLINNLVGAIIMSVLGVLYGVETSKNSTPLRVANTDGQTS